MASAARPLVRPAALRAGRRLRGLRLDAIVCSRRIGKVGRFGPEARSRGIESIQYEMVPAETRRPCADSGRSRQGGRSQALDADGRPPRVPRGVVDDRLRFAARRPDAGPEIEFDGRTPSGADGFAAGSARHGDRKEEKSQ